MTKSQKTQYFLSFAKGKDIDTVISKYVELFEQITFDALMLDYEI